MKHALAAMIGICMAIWLTVLCLNLVWLVNGAEKKEEKKFDWEQYIKDTKELARTIVMAANQIQGGTTNIIIEPDGVVFLGTNYTGYTKVYTGTNEGGPHINTINPNVLRFK